MRIRWGAHLADAPVTRLHRKYLRAVELDVLDMDSALKRDDREFEFAVLVIAGGLLVGPFPRRLIALRPSREEMILATCKNMRAARLWSDDLVIAEWLDPDFSCRPVALWVHSLVAEGQVSVKHERDGVWRFAAVESQR
jgi:hypothetical protein